MGAPRWVGGCGVVLVALVSLGGEAGCATLLPGPWHVLIWVQGWILGCSPAQSGAGRDLCPTARSGVPFARVGAAACGCHAPRLSAAGSAHAGWAPLPISQHRQGWIWLAGESGAEDARWRCPSVQLLRRRRGTLW